MPSVFITRYLSKDSPFQKILAVQHFEVYGESLIEFQAIPFHDIPTTDWIFFYSKNAVHFFFEQLKKQSKKIAPNIRFAAIGKGTATALTTQYIKADFVGNGKATETASLFKKIAAEQKVLFPRASTSHQSIQKLLANDIKIEDLIVYENRPKTNIKFSEVFDYLVFTSSMNVKAYFQKYDLQTQQQAIAIGEPTAQTLKSLGINKLVVASKPSEIALAEAVLECAKKV